MKNLNSSTLERLFERRSTIEKAIADTALDMDAITDDNEMSMYTALFVALDHVHTAIEKAFRDLLMG